MRGRHSFGHGFDLHLLGYVCKELLMKCFCAKSYIWQTDRIIDAKTNLKIYLDFRVNKLNKLSTLILNFREYLLYSLQNKNIFIW